MYSFSKRSKDHLRTCDKRLRLLLERAIEVTDFSVLQGHRDRETHERYLMEGRSQVPYERSRHSKDPSMAVDIAPYPIDWKNIQRFHFLAGVIFAFAHAHYIDIRWGGNWRGFKDYPHFEIIGE